MEPEQVLEEKVDEIIKPILNPQGHNKQDTEELIKSLSPTLKSNTWPEVKDNTIKMIKQIVKGYEIQSGEKYNGFLPEEMKDADNKSEYSENRT